MIESQNLGTLIPVAPGIAAWLEAEIVFCQNARLFVRTFARTRDLNANRNHAT